jgi:hypothetical protein
LRPGDCIGSTLANDEFSSIEKVPCTSEGATGLVTSNFKVSLNGTYPGESYFDLQFTLQCDVDATWFLSPTRESWEVGDRTVACVAEL